MFLLADYFKTMTQDETITLETLVKIHRQQASDSSYFDAQNGGVYSNDLGIFIGKTGDEVELIAKPLEPTYLVMLDRGNAKIAYKGLQAKQAALDFADGEEAKRKQAQANAEAAEVAIGTQASTLETELIALKTDPTLSIKVVPAIQKLIERLIELKRFN